MTRPRETRTERRNRLRRNRAAAKASESTVARMESYLSKVYGMSRVKWDRCYCAPGTYALEDEHGMVFVGYSVRDGVAVQHALDACTSRKRRHSGFITPWQNGSIEYRNERLRGTPAEINCWRYVGNGERFANGVEMFLCGTPSKELAALLEARGWKWNNLLARWYISLSRTTDEAVRQVTEGLLNLRKIEDAIR